MRISKRMRRRNMIMAATAQYHFPYVHAEVRRPVPVQELRPRNPRKMRKPRQRLKQLRSWLSR